MDAGARPVIEHAQTVLLKLGDYVAQQQRRMNDGLKRDPELAIGTAKEMLETVAKTILTRNAIPYPPKVELPKLMKMVTETIQFPEGTEEATRVLLGSLVQVAQRVGELRSLIGTGHGKEAEATFADHSYARLVVDAACTVAVFLVKQDEKARVRDGTSDQ